MKNLIIYILIISALINLNSCTSSITTQINNNNSNNDDNDNNTNIPIDLNTVPIGPLSNLYLQVKKPVHASTRIDVELIPLDNLNATFVNFSTFTAFANQAANRSHLENIFRQIRIVIDAIGLNTEGYRLIFDEVPPPGLPFHFRLYGGEPLTNTVQLVSGAGRGHGPSLDHNQNYTGPSSFSVYFNNPGCITTNRNCISHNVANKSALTFTDMHQEADVHMLAIPSGPYVSTYQFANGANADEINALFKGIEHIINANRAPGYNFRMISNAGWHANQSVPHMHIHVVRGGPNRGPLNQQGALAKEIHRKFTIYNIKDILPYIHNNTLVVFDIDETLILAPGHHPHDGINILATAESNHTKEMWDYLQAHQVAGGAKIIGLTARCPHESANADLAHFQLNPEDSWLNGIDFSGIDTGHRGHEGAVLYMCHDPQGKGKMLLDFLNAIDASYNFKNIIFADDNLIYINQMHNKLKSSYPANKSSISFHYRGAINPITNAPIYPH